MKCKTSLLYNSLQIMWEMTILTIYDKLNPKNIGNETLSPDYSTFPLTSFDFKPCYAYIQNLYILYLITSIIVYKLHEIKWQKHLLYLNSSQSRSSLIYGLWRKVEEQISIQLYKVPLIADLSLFLSYKVASLLKA